MFRQMIEARMNDLHYKYDEETGLKPIIAIHSTPRSSSRGSNQADMQRRIQGIHDTLLQIFRHQQQSSLPSSMIANQLAEAALYNHLEQLSA